MEELRNVPPEEEIDRLYMLVRRIPDLLHSADEQPFVDTPLHFGAGEGRTRLALEIQRLMPSFGRKLNPDGWSPLHVALHSGHMETAIAMVKRDPQLVGVQGRKGMTPLHYMAETGNVDVLAEFLCRCPDSINQLTIDGESAVHVAVRNSKLEAVKLLVGWLKRRHSIIEKVLRRKDREGNTVLHLAALSNQPEMIELLVKEMYVNDKNLNGLTALDMAMGNQRAMQILQQKKAKHSMDIPQSRISSFARYLTSPIAIMEWIIRMNVCMESGLSTNTKNSILVVAVLIATATFQTALSPPGGFSNQSPTTNGTITTDYNTNGDVGNGKVIMSGDDYNSFTFAISMALATSLATIFVMLPLGPSLILLYASVIALMESYLVAIRVTAPPKKRAAGAAISQTSFALFVFIMAMRHLSKPFSLLTWWILNKGFGVSERVIIQAMNSLTVKAE